VVNAVLGTWLRIYYTFISFILTKKHEVLLVSKQSTIEVQKPG
jgi:hypothetical protein